MSADVCGGQKMVSDPEAGITDCCVLPKVGAGNQNQCSESATSTLNRS